MSVSHAATRKSTEFGTRPSPFRYQVCETDCFPTSVLNGLSHRFDRRCIPGAVVQRIYVYCLDGVSRGAIIAECQSTTSNEVPWYKLPGNFQSRGRAR